MSKMDSIIKKLLPLVLVLMLLFGVTSLCGCKAAVVTQPKASVAFYIGIDHSASYGMDGAKRIVGYSEVFDEAKNKLFKLLSEGIFKPGDRIVGFSQFTDEPKSKIADVAPVPITVGEDGWASIKTQVKDALAIIRPRTDKRNYHTFYRNVLDRASDVFDRYHVPLEERLFILLTDKDGSDVGREYDVSPQQYQRFPVIIVKALPMGGGNITISRNKLLAAISSSNSSLREIVAAIRNNYVSKHTTTTEKYLWGRTIAAASIPTIIFLYFMIWVSFLRPKYTLLLREKDIAPSASAFYNAQKRLLLVTGKNFAMPDDAFRYELVGMPYSTDNLSLESSTSASVLFPEPLPEGKYTLRISPKDSAPLTCTFAAERQPTQKQYKLTLENAGKAAIETYSLTGNPVNITERLGLRTSILAQVLDNSLILQVPDRKAKVMFENERLTRKQFRIQEGLRKAIFLELATEQNATILLRLAQDES